MKILPVLGYRAKILFRNSLNTSFKVLPDFSSLCFFVKRNFMKKLLLICLFLSVFSLVKAQTAKIYGTLVKHDHQAAEFVTLSIKGSTLGTVTDARGNFTVTDLPAGKHTLVAGMAGNQLLEQEFSVTDGQQLLLRDLQLNESSRNLDEVTISTVRNVNDKPVSIGKMAIKSMDLPQSVSIIEKDVLEKQQTQYVSDALRNFNGVYIMGTTGGVQQEIAARGFALSSSNTFKNGVRFNNTIMPEMSSLERLEILKGSAAILYGNVAAGGIINFVTKKPTFTNGGELSMRFDSYNFYKPVIDLYGVLDKKANAAFRLNSSYENAGSFRKDVRSERVYFNPSLAFKLGNKTDLIVEGDYLKDNRTADFGVGAINYALANIPRSTFLGAKWSRYISEQKSATMTLTHRISRNWQVRSTSSAQMFTNDLFSTMRPNSNNQFIKSDGKWIRGVQRQAIDDQYFISQLDLTGRFNTGFVRHTILAGADVDRYSTTTLVYNSINRYDSINVFNTDLYKQRNDIPDLTKRTSTEVPIQRAGFYLQDLADFGKVKVLAGLRYSMLQTGSRVTTFANNTFSMSSQKDMALSPRLGIVYQPTRKVSVFGSYANSFTPNTGVDVDGNNLKPSVIDQYEGGIKTNLFRDRISANVTAYQIVNSNLAQTSLANGNTNSNIKELAGEVTSKGIEVDVMTKSFYGFMIVAGYSYNETRYTKSNTYIVGSLLRYNPNHTANASLYYTFQKGFAKGLNLGASALYFGERMAGRSTRVTVENDTYKLFAIPAYTSVDLSAGYTIGKMAIRCKVSNLLNALSYNVHDDNSVNPIAPRQFAATFAYKF